MTELTDKDLLERVCERDERAFNELYRRYARLFLSWVYSRLRDEEMTKDVTQNFWEEIWTNPSYFKTDEEGSAKKVFVQFLAFRAINYVKSGLGRSLGSEMLLAEAEATRAYTSVLEEVGFNEMMEFIEATLATLPRLSQQVFEMQTWKHYSVKRTSELLGVSEKTVRDHYNSVLIALRASLSRRYGDELSKYRACSLLLAFLLGAS